LATVDPIEPQTDVFFPPGILPRAYRPHGTATVSRSCAFRLFLFFFWRRQRCLIRWIAALSTQDGRRVKILRCVWRWPPWSGRWFRAETVRFEFVNFTTMTDYVYDESRTRRRRMEIGVGVHAHSGDWHPADFGFARVLDCSFYGLKPAGRHPDKHP